MHRKTDGFTLIELIVVIVVIAILFGIVAVALSYGSWRQRTATNEVTNDLKAAASAMRNYRTYNNVYPTSVPTTFAASPNVTVTYGTGSTTTFCLNGASTAVTSVQYKITDTSDPVAGVC